MPLTAEAAIPKLDLIATGHVPGHKPTDIARLRPVPGSDGSVYAIAEVLPAKVTIGKVSFGTDGLERGGIRLPVVNLDEKNGEVGGFVDTGKRSGSHHLIEATPQIVLPRGELHGTTSEGLVIWSGIGRKAKEQSTPSGTQEGDPRPKSLDTAVHHAGEHSISDIVLYHRLRKDDVPLLISNPSLDFIIQEVKLHQMGMQIDSGHDVSRSTAIDHTLIALGKQSRGDITDEVAKKHNIAGTPSTLDVEALYKRLWHQADYATMTTGTVEGRDVVDIHTISQRLRDINTQLHSRLQQGENKIALYRHYLNEVIKARWDMLDNIRDATTVRRRREKQRVASIPTAAAAYDLSRQRDEFRPKGPQDRFVARQAVVFAYPQ